MSRRARTELIFQEAILSGEDMAWALAGGGAAVDICGLVSRQRKAPAPGAWSEGQPSVCYARSITRGRFGPRSAERRVGHEGVSTCDFAWAPLRSKKKTH